MVPISLIVATYNWPEALNLCLLSIQNQTVLPKEIIVADDGSASETRAIIEQFQSQLTIPVKYVWHKDLGFRKSLILNKAIKSSSGDYIIQIDGDVILDRHFISDHASVVENGFFIRGTRSHISKDALSSVFLEQKIHFNYFSRGVIHRFNSIRIPLLSLFSQRKSRKSTSVRGSNLAFWKADYELVNGYNNDLQGWGHEDEELATRFINNGILKKIVKFKAIQYHLLHEDSPRHQKDSHTKVLKKTREKQLKKCANGYKETIVNSE